MEESKWGAITSAAPPAGCDYLLGQKAFGLIIGEVRWVVRCGVRGGVRGELWGGMRFGARWGGRWEVVGEEVIKLHICVEQRGERLDLGPLSIHPRGSHQVEIDLSGGGCAHTPPLGEEGSELGSEAGSGGVG